MKITNDPNADQWWCEHCDAVRTRRRIQVWGEVVSGDLLKDSRYGETHAFTFALCDDCVKLVTGS